MANSLACEFYTNNKCMIIDKENSSIKNPNYDIEYSLNWINDIKQRNEIFDLKDGNDVSLSIQKQDLKGSELILDQQVNKIKMEINKQTSFNTILRYQLSANDSYVNNNPIVINFALENLSSEDLWVLKWYTPLEGLKGKIFRVSCDGKEIPYEGPMVKRGQPTKSDYILIHPGKSVSAPVDLSSVYKLSSSQKYLVEFKGRIYDFAISDDSIPKSTEEHQMIKIPGNTVTFRIVSS
jgi:hypothetical protein